MENISDAYLFGVRLKSCVYPFFLFPLPRKWMNGESREKEFSVNDHGNTERLSFETSKFYRRNEIKPDAFYYLSVGGTKNDATFRQL